MRAEPGRDEAFTAYLQGRYAAHLRTAYLLTGELHQAEDILQTALAKLYLAWDRVQARDSLDAYLRRIMVNECHSLWRRAWKRREVTTEEFHDPPTHQDAYDEGLSAEVWALVESLPRRARAVVVLRYYEGLTEPEVADALGISVGTVKSQASRALAALRERTPAHLLHHLTDPEDQR